MSRAASDRHAARRAASSEPARSLLQRNRFAVGGLVILAAFGAFLYAWPLVNGQAGVTQNGAIVARPAGAPLYPTTTPVPRREKTQAGFQPASLTESDVIDVIANRPVNGVPYTTLRQKYAEWSADYQGDGSWLVKGGDASWLVFEQSRSSMPANTAAVNLETRNRAGTVR